MGEKMNLLQKIQNPLIKLNNAKETAVMDRRQFLERMLVGTTVITISWLASDQLYENYGGTFEEAWLRDYYKSDFNGV